MSRPWMPLYVADYRADTGHLSTAEHGAYLLLIMHYWQTGGLPTEDTKLARIAGMTGAEWRKSRATIAAFFSEDWKHKRIDVELARATEISNKRRASVNQRYKKRITNEPTNVDQLNTHARASSQSQSQEKKPKKVSSTRKHVLPADWTLPIEGSAYARSKGWSEQKIDTEAIRFRDHALAHHRLQADWAAAWRNWVTSPFQKPEPTNGNRGQGHRSGGDAFFAGLASVAADIAGDGPVAERADPHIPPGRYEIDG